MDLRRLMDGCNGSDREKGPRMTPTHPVGDATSTEAVGRGLHLSGQQL